MEIAARATEPMEVSEAVVVVPNASLEDVFCNRLLARSSVGEATSALNMAIRVVVFEYATNNSIHGLELGTIK